MAVGESRNFTCRMTCADGREASVLWRGLDTSLGAVQSGAGLSVLYVLNASLSAAGTRVCVGSCRHVSLQHRVRLLVFGEPPPLPRPLRTRALRPLAVSAWNASRIAHHVPAHSSPRRSSRVALQSPVSAHPSPPSTPDPPGPHPLPFLLWTHSDSLYSSHTGYRSGSPLSLCPSSLQEPQAPPPRPPPRGEALNLPAQLTLSSHPPSLPRPADCIP